MFSFASSSTSSSSAASRNNQSSKVFKFADQAKKLSLGHNEEGDIAENVATAARFVTPRDAVVEIANGERLPVIPVEEARKLNWLRNKAIDEEEDVSIISPDPELLDSGENDTEDDDAVISIHGEREQSPEGRGGSLDVARPPAHTHPLFPPLPLYGPPSFLRTIQCHAFRTVSFCLSLSFLGVIIIGSCVSGVRTGLNSIWAKCRGRDLKAERPFYKEELERASARRKAAIKWKRKQRELRRERMGKAVEPGGRQADEDPELDHEYPPLEGGDDPVICDIGYYARRVGLDVETFKVQTEDGFILTLWHVYNPREYAPLPDTERGFRQPDVFYDRKIKNIPTNCRYPVLLIHGLLQSSGAFCVNDDDSLAFYLCKAGYDVWLGDNRCGFKPEHKTLKYADPRMWCWNIRHMGVLDLPAFISRVLYETGFEKVALVCHSQGTTETMVALSEDQRPELGERVSVFCGLAPAAYAGPLIKKAYFRFMRMISPNAFRLFFGFHSFIPFMMTMHNLLPSRLYGTLGYCVFAYLFDWTDRRWDRGLRDRMFQFSPVYISAESMRWWLGRDGFAVQKCILATEEQGLREDQEDQEYKRNNGDDVDTVNSPFSSPDDNDNDNDNRGENAWYGPKTPPFAFWIAGSDGLVDGRRLLRRIHNGREPHVNLVHYKIIDEYEHLDVLWAMDAIEQVGKEVAEVVWRTVPYDVRDRCRVPKF